jgi:MoaA/NifB/PqqE/SkfB family radical SAM enzyme
MNQSMQKQPLILNALLKVNQFLLRRPLEELPDDKIICTKPFTWFEITDKGDIYLCCPIWLPKPIGNLNYTSIEEIWNGEIAQEIRKSIFDGSFKYCNQSKCAQFVHQTGPVKRVRDLKNSTVKMIIKNQMTTLPILPMKINCSFDRSCNLSCPSCRQEKIIETKNEQQILRLQKIIEDMFSKDACFLYITGSGDPFGSPYFKKWLQTMKHEDMPNLKMIHLHTNAQLWTSKLWETIHEDIRSLITEAEISIDAASSETYSINRRGGVYKRLLENLEFISHLRKKGPLQYVRISMVVQDNNFLEMVDFIKLGERFAFDCVYFSLLSNWGTFSDEEFENRAVHLSTHPRHQEFLNALKDQIFDSQIVDLGELTPYRNLG